MRRIVLDTNILISALRSRRGASFRLLTELSDARWQPMLSVALVLEYEAVAKREASRLGLSMAIVDAIIDMMCRKSVQPLIRFRLRPALRDPDDEFLLELAVAGAAEFIVTYNLSDFRDAERYGVRAVTPAEFLAIMEEQA